MTRRFWIVLILAIGMTTAGATPARVVSDNYVPEAGCEEVIVLDAPNPYARGGVEWCQTCYYSGLSHDEETNEMLCRYTCGEAQICRTA
jgi:hypothetical protein